MFGFSARAIASVSIVVGGVILPASASVAGDACVPVRVMMAAFNSVPKVRFTGRFVDHGSSGTEDEIVIGPKRYSRHTSGSWTVLQRKIGPPESATNCAFLRHEVVGGTSTTVYRYERKLEQVNFRVEMWISSETGLPVKSHFQELPLERKYDRFLTYSYGDEVKAPI